MTETIKNRIKEVKKAESSDDLKTFVCSFYEMGDCPDCIVCRKLEEDLLHCRDYYLENIVDNPLEIWDDTFGVTSVIEREPISITDIKGINIVCDRCYIYDKCPMYKKGYSCGIDWGHNKPSSSNDLMDFIIDLQYERIKRASVFEKIDGGVPDAGLSGEMDRLNAFLVSKTEMNRDKVSISLEASSPSGGGILSKIFGGGALASKSEELPPARTEDVEAEIIEPEKLHKRKE